MGFMVDPEMTYVPVSTFSRTFINILASQPSSSQGTSSSEVKCLFSRMLSIAYLLSTLLSSLSEFKALPNEDATSVPETASRSYGLCRTFNRFYG